MELAKIDFSRKLGDFVMLWEFQKMSSLLFVGVMRTSHQGQPPCRTSKSLGPWKTSGLMVLYTARPEPPKGLKDGLLCLCKAAIPNLNQLLGIHKSLRNSRQSLNF